MRKDLGLHPGQINLTQQLKPMGHIAHDTIGLLKSKLGERVISRNDPVNKPPPRSCDLTSLVLFSLGLRQSVGRTQSQHRTQNSGRYRPKGENKLSKIRSNESIAQTSSQWLYD